MRWEAYKFKLVLGSFAGGRPKVRGSTYTRVYTVSERSTME